MANKKIITIGVELIHETANAYLIDTGDEDDDGKAIGVWVPKSQCEYSDGELQIPEWLGIEKGLV